MYTSADVLMKEAPMANGDYQVESIPRSDLENPLPLIDRQETVNVMSYNSARFKMYCIPDPRIYAIITI